ncbi:MAG: DUF4159 domain-containing protein [Kofleriaceae bacterium]|jgi:hypothetical protein|nr:DUF4159 domain-containing protein [Kofleriaceae bacterium]MBP6838215.1 DUF4159 domain-containing protein [Kofleriaceae bacterium]MBP9204108.1 DUF4159 domain-containing protein [Kofleriaceae bacterium]
MARRRHPAPASARAPSRRRFLGAAGLAAGGLVLGPLARRAAAIGPGSKFRFAQLQLGAAWNPRPSALRRLAWELDKRTSIDVELEPLVVPPVAERLHQSPFLVLSGDRAIDLPPAPAIEALRRFLTFGGFLLIDSAEGSVDGAFDQSVRRLIGALFPAPAPASGLEVISPDHVLYKSFYLLDRPLGRVAVTGTMEGVVRDGRVVVAYVQNDLSGAWARDSFGNFEFTCEPGGERQRELAFRLGINLVMYALCLDYKTDQVHVPFIMRRRRWRADDTP